MFKLIFSERKKQRKRKQRELNKYNIRIFIFESFFSLTLRNLIFIVRVALVIKHFEYLRSFVFYFHVGYVK